jgi:hypothetical protein
MTQKLSKATQAQVTRTYTTSTIGLAGREWPVKLEPHVQGPQEKTPVPANLVLPRINGAITSVVTWETPTMNITWKSTTDTFPCPPGFLIMWNKPSFFQSPKPTSVMVLLGMFATKETKCYYCGVNSVPSTKCLNASPPWMNLWIMRITFLTSSRKGGLFLSSLSPRRGRWRWSHKCTVDQCD